MALARAKKIYHHAARPSKDGKSFRAIFVIVAAWALLYAVFEYAFPIFAEEHLQNIFLVGVVTSAMSLVSFFTSIPFGLLARKSTLRRLLVISLSFFLVTCALLFFTEIAPFIILFGVALIYGLFFDLFDMSVYSYLFRQVKAGRAASRFAVRDIFESVGLVFGYILAGILISLNLSMFWAGIAMIR